MLRHVLIGPPVKLATRLRVEGREHVPPTGPLIVASNHLSFMDSIVVPLACRRQVHFLGKAEYFQGPGCVGQWCAGSTRPAARSRSTGATRGRGPLPGAGRGGAAPREAFGVYPEGTRSPDGRLHRGRTGVARMAVSTGATCCRAP